MRRTSLTAESAQALAKALQTARVARGMSIRRVAALSGVNMSSISRLEAGEILAPQVDTLRELAAVLEIPLTNLFAAADWLPADELPTLQPYLRAKYRDLDETAIADLDRYAQALAERCATSGPRNHEDEIPD